MKRAPDCSFFTLINNYHHSPAAKRAKGKKDRSSKASRLSVQSSFTVASEGPSVGDLAAEEGDSILTTATTATTSKMGKAKKIPGTKGRKTKPKRDEPVEVTSALEVEDVHMEAIADPPPKATRGRKRKTEDNAEPISTAEVVEPLPKRRVTRTRASVASNESSIGLDDSTATEILPRMKTNGRKAGRQSTRKVSGASVASLRGPIPNDDEIDAALEADLDRPLTDDEGPAILKRTSNAKKATNSDHAMFGTEPLEIDEAAIEAELRTMEEESKPLPKGKGAKAKQPRKVSAKHQSAVKRAAEIAVEKEAAEEEADVSQQIVVELENSMSLQDSPPVVEAKGQRASSRQPPTKLTGRATRGSIMSVNENNASANIQNPGGAEESGDESVASQSTIVRGSKTRRGSTLKRGKGTKNAVSRNIEEVVNKNQDRGVIITEQMSVVKEVVTHLADVSIEEAFYTPVPEVRQEVNSSLVPLVLRY